ncbi:MAG: hypothetical protein IJX12_03135 [Lachnospiraceae bacterium]|nr:hypothetical protein [Lachnospiraceae bacterium]
MRIQNNILAMNAEHIFNRNTKIQSRRMEKLSSGYKLNRSADDAAGLSISEKMRNQIRGLNMATNNIEDGISYVQVAEGALSEIHSMLHRMEELAVKSANDVNNAEDREAIDNEIQCLKEEIERVLEETEFNGKKIWDENAETRTQVGTKQAQALNITSQYRTFTVSETNKGAIAKDGYTISVLGTDDTAPDTYGFKVSWTGWNGNSYESGLIGWDDIGAVDSQDVSFNLADYLDTTATPELDGISLPITWASEETATLDDIAQSLDGATLNSYVNSSERVTTNNPVSGVSFSIDTNYLSELASDRNVDAYDTEWMESDAIAGTPNITSMPTYTDVTEDTGWEIQFNMKNIGTVKATATNMHYYSNDLDADDEGSWWEYHTDSEGNKYKVTNSYGQGAGTTGSLLGATDTITNSLNRVASNGKGLSLTDDAENGGTMVFTFDLTADNSFSYGGNSSANVGTLTMNVKVYDDDTEETLMQRLQSALNDTTVLDVEQGNQNTNAPSKTSSGYWGQANNHKIEVPVYKVWIDLGIQTGANEGECFHIKYDVFRLDNLGIGDTNVLTREDSEKAMGDIQEAVRLVSEQRSQFGAYTNRMEFSLNGNENYAENLQSSESQIRDADMAYEMMEYSKISILQQAAQAMLTNANNQPETVLQLLPQ